MAQQHCGEYRQKKASGGLYDARLHLNPDHTFGLIDFTDHIPPFELAGEKVQSCAGEWRAASDDGSLVAELTATEVNGKPTNDSLLFRFGGTSLLIAPPNHKIAEFVRTR